VPACVNGCEEERRRLRRAHGPWLRVPPRGQLHIRATACRVADWLQALRPVNERLQPHAPAITAYAAWLREQAESFHAGIEHAALDPFRGYANAIRDELPDAIAVLDAFHVVRLGSQGRCCIGAERACRDRTCPEIWCRQTRRASSLNATRTRSRTGRSTVIA
jgi:Transposase